tara:strand:- start:300 stop:1715 length:1416 start_codon:yes stop_codon:yes gene_type:complete
MNIKLYNLDTIYKLPKVEWLIDEIIPKDSNVILYGYPGSGKSFIALDMALHIAYGKKWHDLKCHKPGIVVYILGEGLNGFPERVKSWHKWYEQKHNAAFYLMGLNGIPFYREDKMKELIESLNSLREKHKLPISMIIIDTISKAAIGLEENSSAGMSLFLNGYDQLRIKFGSTLLFIHHCGKVSNKGMRGSSALLGNVDTTISIEKTKIKNNNRENPFNVNLIVQKQKDGETRNKTFKLIRCNNSLVPIISSQNISDESILERRLKENTLIIDISESECEEESEEVSFNYNTQTWTKQEMALFIKLLRKNYRWEAIIEKVCFSLSVRKIKNTLRKIVELNNLDSKEKVISCLGLSNENDTLEYIIKHIIKKIYSKQSQLKLPQLNQFQPNHGKLWTNEDHIKFCKMVHKDIPIPTMGTELGRSTGSIRGRFKILYKKCQWNSVEDINKFFKFKDNKRNEHRNYLIEEFQLK